MKTESQDCSCKCHSDNVLADKDFTSIKCEYCNCYIKQ